MRIKRLLSFSLIIAILITLLPHVLINKAAAADNNDTSQETTNMDGTSKEVLDSLRLNSEEVPASKLEGNDNPYGPGTFNMYPRYELAVNDNVKPGQASYDVYDYDTGNCKFFNDKNKNYSNSFDKTYDASNSVGFDPDCEGKKNYIARVTRRKDSNNYMYYNIQIENSYGIVFTHEDLSEFKESNDTGYYLFASLAITAGDYDGDGSEEICVYRPEKNSKLHYVDIYKFDSGTRKLNKMTELQFYNECDHKGAVDMGTNHFQTVQLTSGDLTKDFKDELVITYGYPTSPRNCELAIPTTAIYSYENNEFKKKGEFIQKYDYKQYNSSDESGKTQFGAYGAAAIGDINNDGNKEIVMASYDVNDDILSHNNTDLNQQYALISVAYYDKNSDGYKLGAGQVAQSIKTNSALASGMYDENDQQPIALKCFKYNGTGTKDVIFVAGMLYEFEENSSDSNCRYSGIGLSNGHEANNYAYKQICEVKEIFQQDDECDYNGQMKSTSNIWIGSVVTGNFDNDPNGSEQICFISGRKSKGPDYFRHDLITIGKDSSGNVKGNYKPIVNKGSTSFGQNVDLTAIDNDNDGALMRLKEKSAYFSKPDVIAVLQAAPYFSDLEQIDSDYPQNGQTTFGSSKGEGSSDTNGFEISASIITGYKNETSFFGCTRLGGLDFEVDVHASMGGEFQRSSQVTYSTEFSSDSTKDRVVLCMMPYMKYVYEMFVPGFTMPTEDEYNKKCDELQSQDKDNELANYKMEMKEAFDKGYKYGQYVEAMWTDYIVCIPQDIRMSIIDVDKYDQVAEENGYDKIKGNILKETIGDPSTYSSNSNGLTQFRSGKNVSVERKDKDLNDDNYGEYDNDYDDDYYKVVDQDGFMWVPKGGGQVTESIEKSTDNYDAITWGAGVSSTLVSDGAGFKIGGSLSADYTGSHAWTDSNSIVTSGCVQGIPSDAEDLGYDFKWKFGQWKAKINNENCIVLGYLVDKVSCPPQTPKNLTAVDSTDSTITLNWNHPSNRGKGYELYLVTDNQYSPYYKIADIDKNDNEFVVNNLSPNTSYNFVMKSIGENGDSTYTAEVTGKTRYDDSANVPKVDNIKDLHVLSGSNAEFTANIVSAIGAINTGYQWQKLINEGNISRWVNIPGALDKTLKLNSVQSESDQAKYRCQVTQFVDGNVVYVYSNVATLQIGNKGDSSTVLSQDKEYTIAAVNCNKTIKTQQPINRDLLVDIGDAEYSVKQKDNKYILMLQNADKDAQAQNIYIMSSDSDIGKQISKAVEDKCKEPIKISSDSGLIKISSISQFVYEKSSESGTSIESTGISSDVKFEDKTGKITVGGNTVSYDGIYEDESKTIYRTKIETTETVIDTEGKETKETKTENKYYYKISDDNIVEATPKLQYYQGSDNNKYDLSDYSDVTVQDYVDVTSYKEISVSGQPLRFTIDVSSLSSGIDNIIPTGTVDIEIRYNDEENPVTKTISLPNSSIVNKNTVTFDYIPDREGVYTVTARYKGNNSLYYSVSNSVSFEALAVKEKTDNDKSQSIDLNCDDTVQVNKGLDLNPVLKNTTYTVNDDGVYVPEVNKTSLSQEDVTYKVSLENGENATDYTINDNTFEASNNGVYVIDVQYKNGDDEEILTAKKRVKVKDETKGVQQPIYFGEKKVTAGINDEVINPLINYNDNSTVEYSSSNSSIAEVDNEGKIKLKGIGNTTISAISKVEGMSDVHASYELTVTKQKVTISPSNIDVEYGASVDDIIDKLSETIPNISEDNLKLSDITLDTPEYSTDYTENDGVGKYKLKISGLSSDKYDISFGDAVLTVLPKTINQDDLIVTADNKQYDGTDKAIINAKINDGVIKDCDDVKAIGEAVFDSENAGNDKTVYYKINSLTGENALNYKIENKVIEGITKADINPANVKFNVGALDFIYDGNKHPVSISASINGMLFDDFTVKYKDSETVPEDAGVYPISIEMNDNYTGAPNDLNLTIMSKDQKQLSIIGLPRTIEYKDKFTLSAIGGDGDGKVSWKSSDTNVAAIDENGNVEILDALKPVTITAVKEASTNYKEQTAEISFVPDKKHLTYTVNDLEHVYDGNPKEVSVQTLDGATFDTIYTDENGNVIDKDSLINAGIYTVNINGTGNYEGTCQKTMKIDKASIENKPHVQISDYIYGQAINPIVSDVHDNAKVDITYTGTGILTPQAEIPRNCGKYTINVVITEDNYETITISKNFEIKKKPLNVTVDNASRKYGMANPKFELKYEGFEYNEDSSVLDKEPVIECEADNDSPVGSYDIGVTGGKDDNYEFNIINNGVLTVMPKDEGNLYIIGNSNNITVDDEFTLNACCDDKIAKVKWVSEDPSVASIDENGCVKALKGGTTVIRAVIDDVNYTDKSAQINLNVNKKNITLVPVNNVRTYSDDFEPVRFISNNDGFVPSDDNVKVTYNTATDASVTTPNGPGVYNGIYEINDPKYEGTGTFVLYNTKTETADYNNIAIYVMAIMLLGFTYAGYKINQKKKAK